MIVQLTFMMVFVAYFIAKTKSTTSWWWYAYSTAGGFGILFTFFYLILISRMFYTISYGTWLSTVILG